MLEAVSQSDIQEPGKTTSVFSYTIHCCALRLSSDLFSDLQPVDHDRPHAGRFHMDASSLQQIHSTPRFKKTKQIHFRIPGLVLCRICATDKHVLRQ